MELKLYDAEVKLRVKVPTDEAPPALAAPRVVVVLPASGDGPEKNKERPLPCKLHVAIPNGGEESSEALEQPIVLKVFDGRQVLVSRGLTLKECIPVLSDGAITWSQEISRKGVRSLASLHGLIHAAHGSSCVCRPTRSSMSPSKSRRIAVRAY